MSALDTLADITTTTNSDATATPTTNDILAAKKAAMNGSGAGGFGSGLGQQEQQQQHEHEYEESVERMEAGGGPPMPAVGQAAAGSSIDSIKEHVAASANGHTHPHAHNDSHGGHALESSGDAAAMAAIDARLDSNDAVPHTNGYTDDQQAASSTSASTSTSANEVDYARTANLTGSNQPEGTEQIPPISADVEQPARATEADEMPEQQGEAILPAPGNLETAANSVTDIDTSDAATAVAAPTPAPAGMQDILSAAPPASSSISAPTTDALTSSAPPSSMADLPDVPAPLPSQLVSGSVDTTDAAFGDAASTSAAVPVGADLASVSAALPSTSAAAAAAPIPAPEEMASTTTDAALSPSVTLPKRPFEPDDSAAAQPFQEALDVAPESKRARLTPDPSLPQQAEEQKVTADTEVAPAYAAAPGADAPAPRDGLSSGPEAVAEMQRIQSEVREQNGGEPAGGALPMQQQDDSVREEQLDAEADGDADAEVDAEDAEAEVVEGESSMNIDMSLDQSGYVGEDQKPMLASGDVSAVEEPSSYERSELPSTNNAGGLPVASTSGAPSKPIPAMHKEQFKYAQSIVRALKKRQEAQPFLHPVDPVALGIPHYPQVVAHPMDLSTIERKLQNHQYASSDEFVADIRLIRDNCFLFNGAESPISKWAKTLDEVFDKQMLKMPTIAALQAKEAEKAAIKEAMKRSQSPAGTGSKKAGGSSDAKSKPRRASAVGGPAMVNKPKVGGLATSYEQGYDFSPKSMPGTAGSSGSKKGKKAAGGPPTAPQGMNPQLAQLQQLQMQQQAAQMQLQLQQRQMANGAAMLQQEQLKFCKEVLNHLGSQRFSSFAYPFYEPVDPVALGIPDYPKVIRRPMDLGTMGRKLDAGQYPNATAFENDFKLLVQNCFTYNRPGNPVYQMGEQLQSVFYEKWNDLPQFDPSQATVPQHSMYGGYGGGADFGYGGDDDGMDNDQIMLMQKQLELLTGNLEMMKQKARMKAQHRQMSGMGGLSGLGGMGMPQMGMQQQQMQQMQQMPYATSPPLYGNPQAMLPPPVQAPKQPRPPPAPRAPKPPPKRKPSGSFSSSVPPSAVKPAPPKPRTSKTSQAARERDGDWVPPARGAATSDYEDDEVTTAATVTFDMKRELAEKIQEFDGPKLEKVVEIIRTSAPELLGDDNNEIELDIDMLDQRTLLKLYEYVVRPVGKGRQLKPKKNKPKGRNRGVDELAEEERINALQATLDAMEGSVGGPPAPGAAIGVELPNAAIPQQSGRGDVASSSSEEEDEAQSDSDSDAFAPSPQ